MKNKIILWIVTVIILLCTAGGVYYADASSFDNKKQYILADKLFESKKYQESYAAFLKIRFFSPVFKYALFKQALSAEKLGDWGIAEKKYEHFVHKFPGSIMTSRAEYSLAKCCFLNKDYDKANLLFLKIKENSNVKDYQHAADYFLGKIDFENNRLQEAKKYYFSYLNNAPNGTYSLSIAYDVKDFALDNDEAVIISKIFLMNQKYDEAIAVLKSIPAEKSWTYLAIANFYKNNFDEFISITNEGYKNNAEKINEEDLKAFTAFYISVTGDNEKTIEELGKITQNKVLKDYFLYKKAQLSPQDKKIELYKQIVDNYPKSEYVPDCLTEIFFDYASKEKYAAAVKTANIFEQKYEGLPQETQILFWTGKYLQIMKKDDIAKKYFDKLISNYPDSYYAYRASAAYQNSKSSWIFTKKELPEQENIPFPTEGLSAQDTEIVNMLIELNDNTLWDELPFDNLAVRAWIEASRGNITRSVYLANKYITENKPPYTNPVWKLAFPIMYPDLINQYSKKYKIDPFLMLSLIREESHFNPEARSSSNALGLMQLLPATAEHIANIVSAKAPTEKLLFTPEYNIPLGIAYFDHVKKITDDFPMYAVGGYNGGPNAMNKWRKLIKNEDTDIFVESIPYAESKNYIKKVYRSRYNYSKIY